MLGLLVPNRAAYEPHPSTPLLPEFLRRALRAMFKKQ